MPGLNREFGLAVVGCGAIGRIRAELARDYPGIGWLGLCDINAEVGHKLQRDTGADFFTTDYAELIARPEVDATIVATTENDHSGPFRRRSSTAIRCSSKNRWPPMRANPSRCWPPSSGRTSTR